MRTTALTRLIAGTAAVGLLPAFLALAVHAQTAQPAPGQAPPAGRAEPSVPPTAPSAKMPAGPDDMAPSGAQGPATEPKATTAAAGKSDLLGLEVVGSDGQKVGQVAGVKAEPNGQVREIHIKTGGVLGFGSKTVAVPADKFARTGTSVQLKLTSAEVGKLPAVDAPKG